MPDMLYTKQGRALRVDGDDLVSHAGHVARLRGGFAFDPQRMIRASLRCQCIGKPAGFGRSKRDEYTANFYHKPQDEIQPGWDMSGAVQDLRLFLTMGYRIANAAKFPEWRAGNEFRAIREASLKP